jgi:MOSC domain-containing protein YiiM
MSESLQQLFDTLPQIGQVRWIGIRPARMVHASGHTEAASLQIVDRVEAIAGKGLVGDRYASKNGKRQVTLIQWEHLAAIASMLHRDSVSPELLRRNIAVSGINLLALKNKKFKLGTATLEYTGLCEPCSSIEDTLGPGGYNAVRGHGGITCRIIESGLICIDDNLTAL